MPHLIYTVYTSQLQELSLDNVMHRDVFDNELKLINGQTMEIFQGQKSQQNDKLNDIVSKLSWSNDDDEQ